MKNYIALILLLFISLNSCTQNNKAKEIGEKKADIYIKNDLSSFSQDFLQYAKYRLNEKDFILLTETSYKMILVESVLNDNTYKELFDDIEKLLNTTEIKPIKEYFLFEHELKEQIAKKNTYQSNIEKLLDKAKKTNFNPNSIKTKKLFQTFEKEVDNKKTYNEIFKIHKSKYRKQEEKTPKKDLRTIIKDELGK